jgi:hypothetical protein
VNSRNEESILLAIQDTMTVNYSGHEKTEGMGYNCEKKTVGINSHNCILVTPSGVALGILSQSVSTRKDVEVKKSQNEKQMRKIEEKESYRWLEKFKHPALKYREWLND